MSRFTRLSLLLMLATSIFASSAEAGCVQRALQELLDRGDTAGARQLSQTTERNLQTSRMTPQRATGMSGNGARIEVLEDGTRVVTKPSVVRHNSAGEIRSGDYEIAAGLVDRQLGINAAPTIIEREVDGVRRTVQVFVEDAPMGGSARWNPDELGFFDYLIRNQDRNSMNYLNAGGRPVAIDNAFSFTSTRLVSRDIPDYPRIVRDLASRARGSATARSRLQSLLPNQASYDALRNTTPAQWRTLLRDRLNEQEIVAFLRRRDEILRAVADARRTVGDDVMRAGSEPARLPERPGYFPEGGSASSYVSSAPRSAQETIAELNRSGTVSFGSGNLQAGRTYEIGVLQRNGQMFIGDRLTEGASVRGSIRIDADGVVEISGNASSRQAIESSLRTMLPPGTRIQPVNRIGVATRRVVDRVAAARAPAVEAAGQRAFQQTVNRLTTGRVRVRDGGFKGRIVEGPPAPGNYIIVNARTVNRQGQAQNQMTLIEESGDVGPAATLRNLRGDAETYIPGHRLSVGNVTIGQRGEVTLTSHPQTTAGDIEILNERLRSMGIRAN
ncbi:MAG: hypothetical protein AAB250_16630 [Bdellovibrionota bacterium]